jgi:hypothetical protein
MDIRYRGHSSSQGLLAYLGVMLFYLLCVVGGVFSYSPNDPGKIAAKLTLFLLIFSYFVICRKIIVLPRLIVLFAVVATSFLFVGLLRSDNVVYALFKIDGVVFATALLGITWVSFLKRFGEAATFDTFLIICLGVLVATIVYKVHYGFYDRNVRYLFNGPIVYGWIMAFSALTSIKRWTDTRKFKYQFAFLIFLLGMLWTESKGPLVALCMSLAVYIFSLARRHPKAVIRLVSMAFIGLLLASPFLSDVMESDRLDALTHLLKWKFSATDEGSIGDRLAMYHYAAASFEAHPLLGIGLGNFEYGTFFYPHNAHLEIFVELGVFIGIANIAFIVLAVMKSSNTYRAIIILFAFCSSFSGDMSYLRFCYCFCLVGMCVSSQSRQSDVALRLGET